MARDNGVSFQSCNTTNQAFVDKRGPIVVALTKQFKGTIAVLCAQLYLYCELYATESIKFLIFPFICFP